MSQRAGVVAAVVLASAPTLAQVLTQTSVTSWFARALLACGLLAVWSATALACAEDLRSHRLPDALVLRWGGAGLVLVITSIALGDPATVLGVIAGGAIGLGVLGILALAYPPGMGLGDVKLAGVLGAALLGPAAAGAGLVVAFVLGGGIAVVLMLSGRARKGTAIPFGPMIWTGAALVAIVQAVV